MQTSQEIIKAMFDGKSFDRFAIYEGFWPEALDRWVTQGYPTQVVDQNGFETRVPVDPFQYFDFDMHKCGGFFDTEPIVQDEFIIQETDEWVIKRNGAGATLKWWKSKSGTPEHLDFHMKSREIWEQSYRYHLLNVDYRRFNGKWWEPKTLHADRQDLRYGKRTKKWTWYGHVFVWEVMRACLGDLHMYESLLLDPEWLLDFNRIYTNFFKMHFDVLFKENGLPDGIWIMDDIAYKKGLFASPKVMDKLFMPFYAEIVDYFHKLGMPVVFHSDGNITDAVPMLIDAGFDGLNPIEAKSGCDLLALGKKYRDHIVFVGGLDVRVMETNDRDVIAREVIRILDGMKRYEVPYVFGSDHTVTPLVDFDTYRFVIDLFRENMVL